MTKQSSALIQAVLFASTCCVQAAATPGEVTLRSRACTVTIEPGSLRTVVGFSDHRSLVISAGQDDLGAVETPAEADGKIHWRLPQKSCEVTASLIDNELTVEIRGSRPGSFTWPVLELASPAEALIWPFWEGRFIPVDDPNWRMFLAGQEWDTLEGLCMPFWGVYCREVSLTYIASNRFNNTMAFDAKAAPLTLRFTHDFPPSETEWAYGFLISLTRSTSPVEPARVFRRWLEQQGAFVPMRDKLKRVPKAERLLGAPHAYLWGDGVSLKMLRALKQAGLERARLCVPGWEGVDKRPFVAKAADEMGYLFGTYDSFHSIHDPNLKGTDASWPTAQFDQELYETGAIVRQDGTKRSGFKKQGYLLSPEAARPWVERRVRRNMQNAPYTHYFVDCDAFGSVYDDYSPQHPSTQARDAAARVERMLWIGNTFRVVVGSEGGSSYAAAAVHLVEGMLTPVIGWDDPDMTDKASKFYLGPYYPPDGPRVFVQAVPLKDSYVYLHYDPRFRLPLNEIVFHDSMVSTHHWSAGSLKFTNVRETVALTEMLYQCPPLYHLNLDELKKQGPWISRHDAFFSPIHREVGFARMTDFAWLTPDRLVQRTVFDGRVEIVANFSTAEFIKDDLRVPARSVIAKGLSGNQPMVFSPGGEVNGF